MADIKGTVLGIDTGFRHIGFCIGEVDLLNRVNLLDYGYIDLKAEHDKMNKRSFLGMKILSDWLVDKTSEFDIDSILCETVPPTRFNGRDATLSATCMFRAFCIMKGLRYTEIHSMTAKKRMTGSGKASKDDMKEAVLMRYPEVKADLRYDVYDAISICHTGIEEYETDFWSFV